MTRLTLLFLMAAALVVPGAAYAMPAAEPAAAEQTLVAPDRDAGTRAALNNGVDVAAADAKARAVEAYYASYGEPEPRSPPRSPSWSPTATPARRGSARSGSASA